MTRLGQRPSPPCGDDQCPAKIGNIWRTELLGPRQLLCKERSGSAARRSGHLLRGARHHDAAAGSACTRPHVDHPIGLGHRAHIVFDHHYGIAGIDQALQLHQQPVGVRRMQPGSRLVEHVQASAALAALKLGRQLDTLRTPPESSVAGCPRRR